jgi:hypothetical protein
MTSTWDLEILLVAGQQQQEHNSPHPGHLFSVGCGSSPGVYIVLLEESMRAVGALLAFTFVLAVPAFPQSDSQKSSQPQHTATSTGALAVKADVGGTLFIDGKSRSSIVAGKVTVFNLMPGQHFVELHDAKGNILWQDTVSIPKGEQVVKNITLNSAEPVQPVELIKKPTVPEPETYRKLLEEYLSPQVVFNMDSALTKAEATAARDADDCKSRYRSYQELVAGVRNRNVPQSACNDRMMASVLYVSGRYDEALAFSNKEVSTVESCRAARKAVEESGTLSPADMDVCNNLCADSYRFRARIKHALWDEKGALSDLQTGLACEVKADTQSLRNLPTANENLTRMPHEQRTRLYRAVVLMNLRRYEEAIADVNEAAGHPDAPAIREDIQSAMAHDPGIPAPSGYIASQSGGVASQINDVVKSGRYNSLPPSQSIGVTGSGQPSLSIQNKTAYELTVLMAGAVEKSLVISAGGSQNVVVPAGTYRILGRVKAANVLPFYGTQDYASGGSYRESFYIK